MKIEYRDGDIFDFEDIQIIFHSCNDCKVMGSGIAKQIKEKFPEAYNAYMRGSSKLGTFTYFTFDNYRKRVVSVIGQHNYGTDGKRYTNYIALISGIYEHMRSIDKVNIRNLTIGVPYRIGCDRGGADWNIMEMLLKDMCALLPDYYTLVIVKL